MIPITPITARQHGQARNYSTPAINLGSSLARVSVGNKGGKAATTPRKLPTLSVAAASRRIITARRISDLFLSLPKIAEQRRSTLKLKKESLENRRSRDSVTLGRDDLRRRRLQLQEYSFNRRVSHRSSSPSSRRFYKIATTVRLIVRLNQSLKMYLLEESNPNWSLLEMTLSLRSYFDRVLSFRSMNKWSTPTYNGRLATVLSVPPKLRSNEHVRTIKTLLRGHMAFEDYPDHVQDQLCQSMVYQRYEARRVITKIGHEATTFYLMLSGTVLVNIPELDENKQQQFMRTVNELGAGETFGEIGLITGNKRSATIICKTNVEVLVVDKDAFDMIIRQPLQSQLNIHVDYVKRLELFRYFPCEVLVENSNDFFYQYFKPDVVILSNSVESNYLVIVLSGKCQAVAGYKPRLNSSKKKKSGLTKQLERNFPLYSDRLKRERTDIIRRDIRDIVNTAAIEFNIKAKSGEKMDWKLERFNQRFPRIEQPKTRKTKTRRRSSLTGFFDVMESKHKESGKMQPSFWSATLSDKKPASEMSSVEEIPNEQLQSRRKSRFHKPPPILKRRASQGEADQPIGGNVRTWRRIAALVGGKKNSESQSESRRSSAVTKYAQLAEFNEGKVFGLETLLQKDSTSAISLISEGAECLFISKSLFLEHANAKVLRVVSDLIVTYPSKEFIEAYIKRQKKWKEYKTKLIQEHAKHTYAK